jgi:DNA-binding NarL/FixJ family response regulator
MRDRATESRFTRPVLGFMPLFVRASLIYDGFLTFLTRVPRPVPANVLIAEEATLLRELMGGLVRALPGNRVVADCADLAGTLAACRIRRPDLVILDWHLPGGDASLVLRELKSELPETRWLVLCGRPNGYIVHTALSLGAHGFVVKDSSVSILSEAILRLTGGGGAFCCPISSRLLLETLRQGADSPPDGLTAREREILRHFAAGTHPKRIADLLNTSAKTVQNQLGSIRQKLGIQSTAGLVRYALRAGLE